MKGIADCLVTVTADGKTGKGFVVDGEGKIATNCQLVSAAGKIKVTTHSGDIFLGKVIRLDETRDLALIQIPAKTPVYVTLGDPNSVDVGENVYTLDNPSAVDLTETVISACEEVGAPCSSRLIGPLIWQTAAVPSSRHREPWWEFPPTRWGKKMTAQDLR